MISFKYQDLVWIVWGRDEANETYFYVEPEWNDADGPSIEWVRDTTKPPLNLESDIYPAIDKYLKEQGNK